MQGYSPKLPLMYDKAEDGLYGLNKTINETIRQNLKMLLLTNPGERIMDSNFGVGLRNYLFQQDTSEIRYELDSKIKQQVKKYLSYVQIEEINISPPNSNEENTMFINIRYTVPSLNLKDELNIDS
jgi:phage baseplate assembly protein W